MSTSKRFVTKNGLDNNGNSITNLGVSGASLTLSGANALTFTTSGATNVTFPTSGTLLTTAGTAATVTTNANLTGPITSVGNATSIASQTGTGTQFVMSAGPTINAPVFSGYVDADSVSGMSLPSNGGTFEIKIGTGDGASTTVYNTTIRSWWGIGFRDYLDSTTVKAFIDCRLGIFAGTQLRSLVTTGTAPFIVASTTPVANLSIGGNAATVTTNANLTGPITSVGNATSVASQTGSGSTFVMNTTPSILGFINVTGSGAYMPASTTIAAASGATSGSLITSQGTAGTAGAAFITFHRPSAHAFHVGIDTDNFFKIGGYSLGAASYKIWHEGIDGAGSGLDADLLDGQQGAYYLALANTTGFGTGVATALGVNVGTAGSIVVNGGVLGTPSSGTVTNLTGTASININGTVGATTPSTGAFTSLSANTNIVCRPPTSTHGYIAFEPGNAANSGYIQFMSFTGGVRQGYIGFSNTNAVTIDTGTLPYVAGTHAFTGAITATGGVDKLTTASGVVSVAAATAPSTGQVLMATSATTATWQTPAAGGSVTMSDDTTTNATYYPTIATATSGTLSALKVSSTKFTFNPSTGTMSATILNSLSDANFKTNVVPLTDSAEVVKALQGVSFDWKDGSGSSYGFIAQEVQKIIPHAVSENDNKLGVNYSAIVPFLVETIKTQEDRIARLEEMVAKLLKA